MRAIQLVAVALMLMGAAAASFVIWQLAGTSADEPEFSGPAPVLIGDAPPPVTSTPSASAAGMTATQPEGERSTTAPATPTETTPDRNLAPPAQPAARTPTERGPAEATSTTTDGAARSAARQTPEAGVVPVRVRIPSIGIEPRVVPVGRNERGEMASPANYFEVGWWEPGALPGAYGRAVLAGHVDTPDGEAIFYGIDRLAPGDEIFVRGEDESQPELRFVVTGAALYHVDHAPVEQIFGQSADQELILITCGGSFDRRSGEYLYRRVVFAKLAP